MSLEKYLLSFTLCSISSFNFSNFIDMTTYTNAAGVNPAILHVWGPFYIISVFPIILHLSFGNRLSQNREIIWLSLLSLKVMESLPSHLRRQSIALSDSLIKKCIIHFLHIVHTIGSSSISQTPLITKAVLYVSNHLWLVVYLLLLFVPCFTFSFLH